MAETLLLICALLTFVAVLTASCIALSGATVLFSYIQDMRQQHALMPAKIEREISLAVAEFVKPYRESQGQQMKVEPNVSDELVSEDDYDQWLMH